MLYSQPRSNATDLSARSENRPKYRPRRWSNYTESLDC